MFPLNPKHLPKSMSSLFSAYASFTAFKFLLQTVINELKDFIPSWIRSYICLKLRKLIFGPPPNDNTLILVINKHIGMALNEVYDKVEVYLASKITPLDSRLELSKTNKQKNVTLAVEKTKGQVLRDTFDDVELKWSYVARSNKKSKDNKYKGGDDSNDDDYQWSFELSFDREHKDKVIERYMPYVHAQADVIRNEERALKLYSAGRDEYKSNKSCIDLVHPATFATMAMDPEMKKTIIEDLDRFLERREMYKKVGKAWKRGYLLYGPPGTGKSSLIAAMANYLKFDVYDLELSNVYGNSDLRRVLLSTSNRSIIVVEDIDCSVQIKNREPIAPSKSSAPQASKFTLSGLLNFIDGLWSCCGDERIIVFTTNHKERLDPALLRPGRMDMHIHLSYCTPSGFRILASNYLGIQESDPHRLFGEIEGLIESTEVTPAAVAEELMKNDDADVVLEGLVKFLKEKKAADDRMKAKKAKNAEQKERMKPKDVDSRGVISSWRPVFGFGLPWYGSWAKKVEEDGTKTGLEEGSNK